MKSVLVWQKQNATKSAFKANYKKYVAEDTKNKQVQSSKPRSLNWSAMAVLGLSLLGLSGCFQQDPLVMTTRPQTTEPYSPQDAEIKKSDKVALLLPLTGRFRSMGQSMQNAAEMSLFDHAGDNLNVSMYDTKSNPQGAADAANRAIAEGAGLIVGPVFSGNVQAVAPIARRAGLNVVSFSNNRNVANSGVYALGFSPEEQVKAIMAYAAERGKRSFAVMVPRNAYGSLVEQQVKQIQNSLGITVEFLSYSLEADQLIKDINPLRTMAIDALFIPEGGRSLGKVISAILYQDISLADVQLLGTGQWDEDRIGENSTLVGAWIASSNPQERFSFDTKYKSAFGTLPDRLATLSYDVISMLAVLRRHYGDKAFSPQALTQSRGFDGVDGVFRLTQSGLAERKLSILTVTPQGLKPLKSADDSF